MITVATTRPAQFEAIQHTGDNISDLRKFVEFAGHEFHHGIRPWLPNSPAISWAVTRPGVYLTVASGEWLLYSLRDASWRVVSDKNFKRDYSIDSE